LTAELVKASLWKPHTKFVEEGEHDFFLLVEKTYGFYALAFSARSSAYCYRILSDRTLQLSQS